MATIRSNLALVCQSLRELGDVLNLRRRPLGRKKLGDELLDTAAVAILDRSVNRQANPDDQPWPKLKRSTILRKIRKGAPNPSQINVEWGDMLSFEEIRGRTTVTSNVASMDYGLDTENEQKVEWATEGDSSKNRPARPFYDLGKNGEAMVDELINETIDNQIKSMKG